MALSDKQRIAIIAKALRDYPDGEALPTTNLIRSAEDMERLLADMDLPFQALFAAAQQANERIAALGDEATPEMRRAIVEDVHAAAVQNQKSPETAENKHPNEPFVMPPDLTPSNPPQPKPAAQDEAWLANATGRSVIADGHLLTVIDAAKAAGLDLGPLRAAHASNSAKAFTAALDDLLAQLRPTPQRVDRNRLEALRKAADVARRHLNSQPKPDPIE